MKGFVSENQDLWKPMMEKTIKNGETGLTNWGIGAKIYPMGQDESTVMTWDGYKTLADAMKAFIASARVLYPSHVITVLSSCPIG